MARRGDDDYDLTPEQEAALEALLRAEFHTDPAEAARQREEARRRLPELLPRAAVARVQARVLTHLWTLMLRLPERLHAEVPELTPEALAEVRRVVLEALPGGESAPPHED